MRFHGLALLASAAFLSACGGGGAAKTDTTAAPSAAATTPAPSGGPAVAAAPITGKTWDVKMLMDDKGYRFDPPNLTIKEGDGIKFTVVSGGPHNITFDPPAGAADPQLVANMPNTPAPKASDLMSAMLTAPGDSYTVSFGNVPPGTYPFHCTPHQAYKMDGTVTVTK